MRVHLGILLATVMFIVAFSASAYADTYTAEGPTTVYSKPDVDSEVLGKLKDGRQVEVDKRGTKWLRVILKTSKGKVKGYIPVETELATEEPASNSGVAGFRLGLALFYSYYTQTSRVFSDSDGNQSDISNLTGSDPYFGLLGEYPYSKKLILRGGASFRKINLKGTVKYRSGSVTTADTPVEIKQDFISFFGGGRYFFWEKVWGGVFAEFAMCSQSTVFGTASEKPSYFILQPAIGYDYKFAGGFFVQPEFRLGIFVNTKPNMLNPELLVSSGYEF